jgi:predicted nicotinamide N-methyase
LKLSPIELSQKYLPAKVEIIAQEDEYNVGIQLKTIGMELIWLHICWNQQTYLATYLLESANLSGYIFVGISN